ncbi:hypothetical protein NXX45_01550 [Bacteroides fragilis]|uniref:Uncharacterized protein n=1 Tax=Bacteroides fragilis TaxID=817 RepID=A0AAQ2NIL0_BACFG|nr:hypothetical protein NXX45_01550 [Bacteroides fragilis]
MKRANHDKGSMIVSDPTGFIQPGGNSLSRFVRLCVDASFHSWSKMTLLHPFRFRHKWTAKRKSSETRKSTSWHSHGQERGIASS